MTMEPPALSPPRTPCAPPRWRRVWAATPLVLDDAVSRILDAHPGPFRCVRLTHVCNYAAVRGGDHLTRDWLRVLAAKGVDDLVLVCRPWPISADLPANVLRVASLRRLYLGLWDDFAGSTKALRRGNVVFPSLLELGLPSRPERPSQRGAVPGGAGDEVGDPGHGAPRRAVLGPHLLVELGIGGRGG
uniref:F-box/LRR-repeat protein 15/At3g58940/PEG3-like LRR domain-containing protein n=1 Tax=Setaria viridis TaxID=4556 RepID=A0A4U6VQC3_SETVI|nr:hypothetical protein SEVIR_2G054100v2 [Setaria viridis]